MNFRKKLFQLMMTIGIVCAWISKHAETIRRGNCRVVVKIPRLKISGNKVEANVLIYPQSLSACRPFVPFSSFQEPDIRNIRQ